MIDVLRGLGVEFVEQPLPPHDIDGLRFVRERSPLPDHRRRVVRRRDRHRRLAGAVDGINIKLAKCGGLAKRCE